MEKVESFKLDHNKVNAPYVRKCCVLDGKIGDKVSKFDLRFLQPNVEAFGTASMHGLEHLLATYLREELDVCRRKYRELVESLVAQQREEAKEYFENLKPYKQNHERRFDFEVRNKPYTVTSFGALDYRTFHC